MRTATSITHSGRKERKKRKKECFVVNGSFDYGH